MASKKLNITLEESLIERADNYSEEHGMSRSGLISISLKQYLNAVEAMPSINKLLSSLATVSEKIVKGEIDPSETDKQLDEIQKSYNDIF